MIDVVDAGKVHCKDEVPDGEQPFLIGTDTFGHIQALLRYQGLAVGRPR